MSGVLLIHLSDLHFGQPGWTGTKGQYPHDPGVTLGLGNFFRKLPEKLVALGMDPSIKRWTLVTGDLTVKGSAVEFRAAQSFLDGAGVKVSEGEFIGLGVGGRRTLIPGNHDHWSGREPWGCLLPAYSHDLHEHEIKPHTHIDDCPSQPRCLKSADGGFRVELLGLDSCSGFSASKTNILPRQEGRIDPEQIRWVEEWEVSQEDREHRCAAVRVVAVHHDLDFASSPWRLSRVLGSLIPYSRISIFPWPLAGASREKLLAAADRSRVAGILTGHQHSPWFRSFPGQRPREMRAWSTLGSEELEAGEVGFYLHHIEPRGAGVARWSTYGAVWDPEGDSAGFDLARQPFYRFEIPTVDGIEVKGDCDQA